MFLRRTIKFVAIFASAVSLSASDAPVASNASTQDAVPTMVEAMVQGVDPSIKPGDNFYQYANGGWLKAATIPAGQPSFDNRAILTERTNQRVRKLIQDAAASQAAKGSGPQKVGDYYASFMDQDSIESKGLKPLTDEMAVISAIKDKGLSVRISRHHSKY